MAATGRFRPTLVSVDDMVALKQELGVPGDLASCHTAIVAGYGWKAMSRRRILLRERPAGVRGLAVAGMPLGSPGMETPTGRARSLRCCCTRRRSTRVCELSRGRLMLACMSINGSGRAGADE